MDNKQIAIKLIFKELKLDFNMNTFQDRLVLQKSIYLAQSLGVNLGYHFSWYLRGPYSTTLATDGFAIRDELWARPDESVKWKLDNSISSKLMPVLSWFSADSKEELAKQLELFASVHFLVDKKRMGREDSRELVAILAKYDKFFSELEVQKAVQELSQHGALN